MAEGDLPPLISAKIQLSELAPEDGKDLRASTDKKRWQRIVRIFELQGCDDGKPEHRVPALVRKDELRNVLARSGFLDGVHKQPPKLIFGHALFFLRGRHRLVAAAEFLAVKEQWWTVDLYDQDVISSAQLQRLREEYDNAAAPDDGEIYCKILGYQEEDDQDGVKEEFAKWTPSKTRDFKQLQGRPEFADLKAKLSRLRPFKGLWQALEFGAFRRAMTMRCYEESCALLDMTYDVCSDILGDESPGDLDAFTAGCLEGRSPMHSIEDQHHIVDLMVSGRLFRNVTDLPRRRLLLDRILRTPGIIRTIRTTVEDFKFLEPLCSVLRELFEPKKKESIRQAARRLYRAPQGCQIPLQESDSQINAVILSGVDKIQNFGFWTAYCVLFLFAFRNYPSMTNLKPRIDRMSTAHIQQKHKTLCQVKLAQLALAVGFHSPKICQDAEDNLERFVAADMLLNDKPQGCFEDETERIRKFFPGVLFGRAPNDVPEMTINASELWRLDHRCGRTFDQSFCRDLDFCFFRHIFAPREICPRERLTSFAVICFTFRAFLDPVKQFDLAAPDVAAVFGQPAAESVGITSPELQMSDIVNSSSHGALSVQDQLLQNSTNNQFTFTISEPQMVNVSFDTQQQQQQQQRRQQLRKQRQRQLQQRRQPPPPPPPPSQPLLSQPPPQLLRDQQSSELRAQQNASLHASGAWLAGEDVSMDTRETSNRASVWGPQPPQPVLEPPAPRVVMSQSTTLQPPVSPPTSQPPVSQSPVSQPPPPPPPSQPGDQQSSELRAQQRPADEDVSMDTRETSNRESVWGSQPRQPVLPAPRVVMSQSTTPQPLVSPLVSQSPVSLPPPLQLGDQQSSQLRAQQNANNEELSKALPAEHEDVSMDTRETLSELSNRASVWGSKVPQSVPQLEIPKPPAPRAVISQSTTPQPPVSPPTSQPPPSQLLGDQQPSELQTQQNANNEEPLALTNFSSFQDPHASETEHEDVSMSTGHLTPDILFDDPDDYIDMGGGKIIYKVGLSAEALAELSRASVWGSQPSQPVPQLEMPPPPAPPPPASQPPASQAHASESQSPIPQSQPAPQPMQPAPQPTSISTTGLQPSVASSTTSAPSTEAMVTPNGDASVSASRPTLSLRRPRMPSLESVSINDGRRRQSPSAERPEGISINDGRRRALRRHAKYQIVETNTDKLKPYLWNIEDSKKEIQYLSSKDRNQGQFAERFGKLRKQCPDHMPFCILDEPSQTYIFIAPTENAQKHWQELMRGYAEKNHHVWSVDFEKMNLVSLPWEAFETLPTTPQFIVRKDTKQTVSNKLDYGTGPHTPSALAMPLWFNEQGEWCTLDKEQVPEGFFDL